ncbi:MAG: Isoprenyl transferase 1 [candidate division TM6 bacterium GW2011_GWE2_41_16]|nr:MAG: Isoprenyl transferase 1 [candidate division TM6 bacterium GW2011_GWE2_41_16]
MSICKIRNWFVICFVTFFCFVGLAGSFLWLWHNARYIHIKHIYHASKVAFNVPEKRSLNHVGVIMDGNRRWARNAGLKPWIGHQKGVDPLRSLIELCLERNISQVTVYALSIENLKRPQEELDFLFNVIARQLVDSDLTKLFDQGVRVRFYGDKTLYPDVLKPLVEQVEEKTKNNTKLEFGILLCYGGQQEIVAAAQTLAQKVARGEVKADAVNAQTFEDCLWTGALSQPDLVIRTGFAQRLSNFLTYKSAYSEIRFVDAFWPDVTKDMLTKLFDQYQKVDRTFGA